MRFQAWLVNGILLLAAAVTLYPLVWMVAASLMPAGEAQSFPPRFWPSRITFVHYEELFERLNLARYFANSLLIAGTVTFFPCSSIRWPVMHSQSCDLPDAIDCFAYCWLVSSFRPRWR